MDKKFKDIMWCDMGWFSGTFYYGFAPNKKSWKRGVKKLGIKDSPYPKSAGRCTYFEQKGKRCCVVTIKDGLEKTYTPLEISCLMMHEAVHVWQFFIEQIGEENPSPEFEAYSLQAITQELLHKFETSRCLLKGCGSV